MEFTGERVIEGKTPERIWQDHMSRYRFAASRLRGKRVLDAACGVGYGSKIIKDAQATEVVGADIAAEAIGLARGRYASAGIEFLVADLMALDLGGRQFDAVVSFETIEHVPDAARTLGNLHRSLVAGGALFISTPNRPVTSPLRRLTDPPLNPHHVVEFTAREFRRLLERSGFRVREAFGPRGAPRFAYLPGLRRVLWRLAPNLYAPDIGNPELEPASWRKEYRYITAVCERA